MGSETTGPIQEILSLLESLQKKLLSQKQSEGEWSELQSFYAPSLNNL